MIRFYAPDLEDSGLLPESDSAHCCRVLRLKVDDIIEVTDGKGYLYHCRIKKPDSRKTEVEIIDKKPLPPFWTEELTIAVAPTKNADRMEWLLEKLVEEGIDRFIPLNCARSERKVVNTGRLVKIAVSAMKQSLKATLPEISEPFKIKDFITGCNAEQKFICYCDDTVERRLLCRIMKPSVSTAVLIGPEGDFSPEEVSMALDYGFIPVSLGDARLRTETAALTACITFHIINQLANK